MVLHALEMEDDDDDEMESLMYEVNGGGGGGGAGASNNRNGGIVINGSSAHGVTGTANGNGSNNKKPAVAARGKKATVLFALAALGAVVFVFLLSGGGSDALLKPADDVEDHTTGHSSSGSTNTVADGGLVEAGNDNDTSRNDETKDKTEDTTTKAEDTSTTTTTTPKNDENTDTGGAGTNVPQPEGTTTTKSGEKKKDFVYSNLATIVPDPDHVPVDDETRKQLEDQYGKWHFWDGEEKERPTTDYCAAYPNRDIPGDEFPDTAWQVDAVFVNHILNDAEQLISRAMESIYAEYGHGKPLPPEKLAERHQMFQWHKVAISGTNSVALPEQFSKKGDRGSGGWTTDRSFDGLVKRLLHAIMTNDTFTVVLGGHSAAAGHGNHFRQSYMMQFHKILAPIFARLGVKLVTRNLSQGGLGTLQNSIGMADLYGDEIDLILWDTGMTETDAAHIDLFLRQALLSGHRVPVLWGGLASVLAMLHQMADADVGMWGSGMMGIPTTESEEQVQTLPYAARYLKCSRERGDLCKAKSRFCTQCWIDRPDLNPDDLFDKIDKAPSGQVKWHPGWRDHQLKGRVLAFAILDALQVAIEIFSEGTTGGPPLDDDWWHVTDYYDNIRTKVKNLTTEFGHCHKIESSGLPPRLCHTKLQARSLFTPRANPDRTSLSAIFKPAPDGYVPRNEGQEMYHGPDAHNSCYDLPAGAVDVLAIVSGRRRLADAGKWVDAEGVSYREMDDEPYEMLHSTTNVTLKTPSADDKAAESARNLGGDEIVMGKGWQVVGEKVGQCDGAYYSICGRERSNHCPAIGHHDSRGMVVGNEFAGWLVMELANLKEGLIILKIETGVDENKNTRTTDWTSVNNERMLGLEDQEETDATKVEDKIPEQGRRRRTSADAWPDDVFFDYAIDGKITSLGKEEFKQRRMKPQRVVEMITLLDDPNFTSEARNVELAIRMRNCGRQCTLGVTHAYWA